MYGGTWFYPSTRTSSGRCCWAFSGSGRWRLCAKKKKAWLYVLTCAAVCVFGYAIGTLAMVDYYGMGVLTVFVFYFFRGRNWWQFLGQVLALYWINVNLMGGLLYPISIFGFNFELCQQGLALLALIPIWLYRGRQGYHSKPFQYACYAFYPVHILILGLIQRAL